MAVFISVTPTHNLTKIDKRRLFMYLDHLPPGQLKAVRLIPLRNVVAIEQLVCSPWKLSSRFEPIVASKTVVTYLVANIC